MMPLRAVVIIAIFSPLSILLLSLGILPSTYRIGSALLVLAIAFTISTPMKEGIWIGTYWLYLNAARMMPSTIIGGRAGRAEVSTLGGAVQVRNLRAPWNSRKKYVAAIKHFADIPRVTIVDEGIFALKPGGARAILKVAGPTVSVSSDGYVQWCTGFMQWMSSLEVPAQFLTVINHFDSQRAELAFDRRVRGWKRTRLLDYERELTGGLAEQSLGLEHYVIFSPRAVGPDGIHDISKLTKVNGAIEASIADAERVLTSAERLASSFGIEVTKARNEELQSVLAQTVLGATSAATGNGVLQINDQHHVVMTATKLPPTIEAGVVVEALMRSHTRGIASLHIVPVQDQIARKVLNKRVQMYKYAARQGNSDIDNEVAHADTTAVLAAIAQRELRPYRLALTVSVSHPEREKALEAAERFHGIMTGHGFDMIQPTSPAFLPALALAPGCAPLGRSIQMTSDGVVARMLPALGTPFSNEKHPLIGINALTGAPAYFSIWTPPNHNMVIVGSSGAGKSVATKTLLVRHVMEGVSAVVIDPDSEYRNVMQALGGQYFELGTEALNPLAAGLEMPADTAASLVLPILSVMGGDEKGIREGRPIRRLPDEDQGWMHAEVAEFYRQWTHHIGESREPVLSDLIAFIDTESKSRALTSREADRCRIITSRLRRYTQGRRATVFDRPSTFTVGKRPVAIGLKVFAMAYGADLTPALAVVLTSILAAIDRREGRMIVVVDEAHRVTSDPDAGEVLGQLVRQARKYGAGVWMCSQRVEDFVRTDLGKTLAATASTKLVLGAEEAALEDVRTVFKLRDEEIAAIHPMQQGRGVLLSGAERTVVQVVPGPAIMILSDTSSAVSQARSDAATATG